MLGNFLPNVPHGALVPRKGCLIATSHNSTWVFLFLPIQTLVWQHNQKSGIPAFQCATEGASTSGVKLLVIKNRLFKFFYNSVSNRFKFCFPSDDGLKMVCQHWNGSWIVFPIYWKRFRKQKTPSKEEVSEMEVEI